MTNVQIVKSDSCYNGDVKIILEFFSIFIRFQLLSLKSIQIRKNTFL